MTAATGLSPQPDLDERDFILLDAMAMYGMPIGGLLVGRDQFEECHNIPWHELDFASCARRLARLHDLGYIADNDDSNQWSRFSLWMTPAGGTRWRAHFDVRFDLYIHDEQDFAGGRTHRRFWSGDEDALLRLRQALVDAPFAASLTATPIAAIADVEETPWLRYPVAFELTITHDESLTEVGDGVDAIHTAAIDGWRRPTTLAPRFRPVAWHQPIGAFAGESLTVERLATDTIHEPAGERWHPGLVSPRTDDDPTFLGYVLADDAQRTIWSVIDEAPPEISQWLLRWRDDTNARQPFQTYTDARRLRMLANRRWSRDQPFEIHRVFRFA